MKLLSSVTFKRGVGGCGGDGGAGGKCHHVLHIVSNCCVLLAGAMRGCEQNEDPQSCRSSSAWSDSTLHQTDPQTIIIIANTVLSW